MTFVRAADGRRALTVALVLGLVIRAAVLWHTPGLPAEIVDEQHYTELASSLLAGNGLAWESGRSTSLRPPLYPAFIAVIWKFVGVGDLQAVRIAQVVLSLLTAWLVYRIGRQLFTPEVGRYAAAVTWLYPSLIFFNATILTETLYVLLLTAFVWLSVSTVQQPRRTTALACGVALGLACLTRSALWPLPFILCPLLVVMMRRPLGIRLALATLVFAGYAAVVGPWAVRNTRLQGVVTVVDTMGGLNLHMGNYEHTPDERMWDAIALTGEKSWAYPLQLEHPSGTLTEGQKEKWAQRRALHYIWTHPWISLRRAAIKFADFWGLEREVAAGFSRGMYRVPDWFALLAPIVIVSAFVFVAAAGVVGIWLVRATDWRGELLLLLPFIGITAVHTIVFGHSRYHIPLIPVLALYGAALMHRLAGAYSSGAFHPTLQFGRAPIVGAVASIAGLMLIWGRQVILVDADRIRAFLAHVR